jgi:hypothetical protein
MLSPPAGHIMSPTGRSHHEPHQQLRARVDLRRSHSSGRPPGGGRQHAGPPRMQCCRCGTAPDERQLLGVMDQQCVHAVYRHQRAGAPEPSHPREVGTASPAPAARPSPGPQWDALPWRPPCPQRAAAARQIPSLPGGLGRRRPSRRRARAGRGLKPAQPPARAARGAARPASRAAPATAGSGAPLARGWVTGARGEAGW